MYSGILMLVCFSVIPFRPLCAAEREIGNDGTCMELCKDFASHIYETIRNENQVYGTLPMSKLYTMVKGKAAKFCLTKTSNKLKCDYLLDNAWFVIVALETGTNVERICSHLKSCSKTSVTETKHSTNSKIKIVMELVQVVNEFCGDFFRNNSSEKKGCNEVTGHIAPSIDLLKKIANSENPMSELQKCPSSGKGIGCLIKDAPFIIKMTIAMLNTMVPSVPHLKKKLQEKFIPPHLPCALNEESQEESEETKLEKHKNISQKCIFTCKFVAGNFLQESKKKSHSLYGSSSCAFFKSAEANKCERLSSLISKLIGIISEVMPEHLCANICKIPKSMSSYHQKDCMVDFQPVKYNDVIELNAKRTAKGKEYQVRASGWLAIVLLVYFALAS